MRTESTIKNSITGALSSFTSILINFVSQKIFIILLGIEYLGLNGLFSNILSILSIAELGIGEAIIFNMYKPIANNDRETIKSLMKFYKKAYTLITMIILIAGLCITPFITYFVGNTKLEINIHLVYLFFLAQTVCSYVLTYKRSILYAYQKNYVINIIHIIYIIILNIFQLSILYLTKNYFLYLGVKVLLVLTENIAINIYVKKNFDYLNDKNIKPLPKHINDDIFNRIKAMFLHKIGGFIVNGTDNILISKFFGVLTVGLYSNYYTITNSVTTLFSQFISSATASIGNLLTENNNQKNFGVFKKIRFLNFYLATFTGTCILIIMQPFIVIWLGEKYLLANTVLFVIVFNYFQKLMRKSYDAFMIAAGICIENRFVPLIESVLNIIFSILCAKLFGLVGIFLGTVLSGLALWLYSYPKFMYKNILKRSYKNYFMETSGYIIAFISIATFTYMISRIYVFNNTYLEVIYSVVLSLIIPNICLALIFGKTEEYKYFINIMKKVPKKLLVSF